MTTSAHIAALFNGDPAGLRLSATRDNKGMVGKDMALVLTEVDQGGREEPAPEGPAFESNGSPAAPLKPFRSRSSHLGYAGT